MPRDTRSASRADRRTRADRGDRAWCRPFLLSCAIRVSPASRFAGGLGKKRTPPAPWREGFWIVLEFAYVETVSSASPPRHARRTLISVCCVEPIMRLTSFLYSTVEKRASEFSPRSRTRGREVQQSLGIVAENS